MSRQIVILGMHRTGTSMIAGVLQLAGVHMGMFRGRSGAEAARCNPKNFFEDRSFLDLNVAVLKAAGTSAFEMVPQSVIDKVTGHGQAMLELVEQRDAVYEVWGFKDPRTLLVLDHWKRYLGNPLLVLTVRSQAAILQSLSRRSSPTRDKALQTLERYDTLLLQILAGHREYIVMPYERTLQDPEHWIGELCEAVGVPMCQEAVDYVDPEKDHYRDET